MNTPPNHALQRIPMYRDCQRRTLVPVREDPLSLTAAHSVWEQAFGVLKAIWFSVNSVV